MLPHARTAAPLAAALAALVALVAAVVVALAPPPARAIVGGTPADEGEHPFMASLQQGGSHFCGGSVVARHWVLTAAHCSQVRASRVTVVVGRTDLGASGGQRLAVDRIVVHPAYDRTGTSDVALWHTARRIEAPAIRIVAAGQDRFERSGTPLTIAGWGTQVFGSPTAPDDLQEAEVDAVADDDCVLNELAGSLRPRTEMCASALGRDSCQGDSGGPLFATVRGRPVQVGAVSYGVACAVPGFDGVYAQLSNRSIHRFLDRTLGRD